MSLFYVIYNYLDDENEYYKGGSDKKPISTPVKVPKTIITTPVKFSERVYLNQFPLSKPPDEGPTSLEFTPESVDSKKQKQQQQDLKRYLHNKKEREEQIKKENEQLENLRNIHNQNPYTPRSLLE
jgi:hypothetical protein